MALCGLGRLLLLAFYITSQSEQLPLKSIGVLVPADFTGFAHSDTVLGHTLRVHLYSMAISKATPRLHKLPVILKYTLKK